MNFVKDWSVKYVSINKATKWYQEENYLEIYHPKDDIIIKIECKSIEKLWDIIISSSTLKEIMSKINEQEIQSVFDEEAIITFL